MLTLHYDFGTWDISCEEMKYAIANIMMEKMKQPKNNLVKNTILTFLDCLDLDYVFQDFEESLEDYFYDEALESYKFGEYLAKEKQDYANRI